MREFPLNLVFLIATLVSLVLPSVFAAEHPVATGLPESDAEKAIKKFRTVPGLKIDLFAAEPLIANPVSFAFDEKGRAYVVETNRRRTSVYDIRNHPDWLDADFSFRTVEDRLEFFKKTLVPDNPALSNRIKVDMNHDGKFDYHDLEVESERIRLLEDRNGDGRADNAITFADGFNTAVSGVAAGILPRGHDVWFTCIPDLWLLKDANGDGQADIRTPLLHGFGVHISYGGHDLHGLCMGPDGKIYFSIADRGLHVETEGHTIAYPDAGAVMRCNPDGSEFELYATGLRNPQELAFDQFGNLWTGDNNGDGGDKARWVYVVEGSDSGWHLGWQHLPKMGPWNAEKLWELAPTNTAAYILPPIAHIGHGPAGLAFYPGTGLPARYQNHFFLCDFPGGVHSFALQPKGAAYEVVDLHEFFWGLYPVDVAFGPEGGAYVADWIEGWDKTGKGRIYRIYDPAVGKDGAVRETKKLLAEGMQRRSVRELSRLLEHVDMRVRQEAQFALAAKGVEVTNNLFRIATKNDRLTARLHAIWALGQIGKTNEMTLACLLPLLAEADPEVRSQAAKVLGEHRVSEAYGALLPLLHDPSLRVRFFAALALGKSGHPEAAEPIIDMLRENADHDLFLRHAGVMALVWLNDLDALTAAAKDDSASVRMAALLAMRRLAMPQIATFLYDPAPALVLEATRAIYDLPIEGALSQVANLISKPILSEPVLRRALNANYRVGKFESALALSDFATRTNAPENLRAEALELLGRWAKPPPRDLVVGLWRPLPARDNRSATLAIRSELPGLIRTAPLQVRVAAIQTAGQLEMTNTSPILRELIADTNAAPEVRAESLKTLVTVKDPRLSDMVTLAMADSSAIVRKVAGQFAVKLKPSDALGQVAQILEKGTVSEQQSALQAMSGIDNPFVDQILISWLDLLASGKIPKELQLDVLEAASKRTSAPLKQKLQQYEGSRSKADLLSGYTESLYGGDAEAGKKIFFERADVACVRCHKIKGEGGEVGPELTGIGTKKPREYILESILFPNNQIAPGYETLIVTMKDGKVYAGQIKNETERELLLITPDDGLIVLGKSQIKTRDRGVSAMPAEIGNILSKRDLRNLVEFLSRSK